MIVNTLRVTAGLAAGVGLWLGGAAVSADGGATADGASGSGTRAVATAAQADGRGTGHGRGDGHHGDHDHCPVTTAWGDALCPGKPLN
ncbi:hypothetical protein ACGFY6_16560 [Streptomyces sp. NPDC048387]|uniref:hypothetical protein n=1 Tax=Streptomyces sp. NPDC048387 TaxID=3365542 RepID=UPI0037232CED